MSKKFQSEYYTKGPTTFPYAVSNMRQTTQTEEMFTVATIFFSIVTALVYGLNAFINWVVIDYILVGCALLAAYSFSGRILVDDGMMPWDAEGVSY